MPRGASPGERRGGRVAGVPNKFGAQRAAAVEREGKRLPPANLLIIAENSMAMAAKFQPGKTDKPNPECNEERYAFWLNRAREALRDAAPYYAPKLHAIAMQTSTLDDRQEGRADPRQVMLETYMAMRERGELAMKAISDQTPKAAETGTNSPTPDPTPQDDGDGVAV
jgi:hypothetical protein